MAIECNHEEKKCMLEYINSWFWQLSRSRDEKIGQASASNTFNFEISTCHINLYIINILNKNKIVFYYFIYISIK